MSPTASMKPSTSPAPSRASAAPSSTECFIQADVTCISEDNGSCDFFNPLGEQCIGGNAQELRFIYTSNSICGGNNTQADFLCEDFTSTVPVQSSTVYVIAFQEEFTVFEGFVNEGNIFSIPVGDNSNSIDIEIRGLTSSFIVSSFVQTMTMSVQCREEDSLTLLDTFGGLQLVGYKNEDQGLKSIYNDLTIQYAVTNVGVRDLFITSALKTTPFTGTQPLLFGRLLSVPGDAEIFSEILTVNLAAIGGGSGLKFSVIVQGEDTATGRECGDSDSYTLEIIEA